MESKMRELSIFIDESGTTKINDELYICAAVMIPTSDVEIVLAQIQSIASKYVGGAIKSSKIRSDSVRTKLLRDICGLAFNYVALIVNKSALEKYPGVSFSGSFYKFFHRKFANLLASGGQYDKLHFYIDTYSTPEFQQQFERYFNERIISLFPVATCSILDDESNHGIQVADLIAGTLGRCYFYNRDSENADTWLKILEPRCAGHKVFPPLFSNEKEVVLCTTALDERIAECLLKNAYTFLRENSNSEDEFVQRQCETLQLLLVKRDYGGGYIFSDKIMEHLEAQGFERISKQLFTSKVIGRLRDSKIIITGNANGYRLALTGKDVESYIRHNDAIISPMVHRLGLASELLKMVADFDVLGNFDNLRSFVNAYRHNATLVATEIDDEQVVPADNTEVRKSRDAQDL